MNGFYDQSLLELDFDSLEVIIADTPAQDPLWDLLIDTFGEAKLIELGADL